MKLFIRYSNNSEYQTYKENMDKKIGNKKIIQLSRKKIWEFFDINDEAHFLRYRFEIFNKWLKKNLRYTIKCIKKIDYLISLLWLESSLNSYESQFLKHIKSVRFAKERNLKNVLVDIDLKKNENVYYVYNLNSYSHNDSKYAFCKMYISTKRIIVHFQKKDFVDIPFEKIIDFHFFENNLTIFGKNEKYVFESKDNAVLYVSLERIFLLEKILI